MHPFSTGTKCLSLVTVIKAINIVDFGTLVDRLVYDMFDMVVHDGDGSTLRLDEYVQTPIDNSSVFMGLINS